VALLAKHITLVMVMLFVCQLSVLLGASVP
jgi:hypothetical protein